MILHINTQIIGKTILYFDQLSSTNVYAYELLSNNNPIEGTTIIADYQSDGKGQYGRTWVAVSGLNLLMSVIVMPRNLKASDIFMLNVMLSVSIYQLLSRYSLPDIKIKWPNDIYVSGSKICGLLIQNILQGATVKSSILGVGLNINQTEFDLIGHPATSVFNEIKGEISIAETLKILLPILDDNYKLIQENNYGILLKIYNDHWLADQKYNHVDSKEIIIIQKLMPDGQILATNKKGSEIYVMPNQIEKLK